MNENFQIKQLVAGDKKISPVTCIESVLFDSSRNLKTYLEYKLQEMQGATELSGGVSGLVPAPTELNKFLNSDGNWTDIQWNQVLGKPAEFDENENDYLPTQFEELQESINLQINTFQNTIDELSETVDDLNGRINSVYGNAGDEYTPLYLVDGQFKTGESYANAFCNITTNNNTLKFTKINGSYQEITPVLARDNGGSYLALLDNYWEDTVNTIYTQNDLYYYDGILYATCNKAQTADKLTNGIPQATGENIGGIKIGYTTNGNNYAVQLSNGKAYVNVPPVNVPTYTFDGGTNSFTVTPSGGSKQTVDVIPYIDKNVTYSDKLIDGRVAVFDGTDGKIKASGCTIAASVPLDAKFTDTKYTAGSGLKLNGTEFNHADSIKAGIIEGSSRELSWGDSFDIPKITYNDTGHITEVSTTQCTLPDAPGSNFVICKTLGSTQDKYISVPSVTSLTEYTKVSVQFTNDNTAFNPKLWIEGLEAKPIKYQNNLIKYNYLVKNRWYDFIYREVDDDGYWELTGDLDIPSFDTDSKREALIPYVNNKLAFLATKDNNYANVTIKGKDNYGVYSKINPPNENPTAWVDTLFNQTNLQFKHIGTGYSACQLQINAPSSQNGGLFFIIFGENIAKNITISVSPYSGGFVQDVSITDNKLKSLQIPINHTNYQRIQIELSDWINFNNKAVTNTWTIQEIGLLDNTNDNAFQCLYANGFVGRLEGYETSTIRGSDSLSLKPQYFNKFNFASTTNITNITLKLNPGNISNRVYEYLCEIENNKTAPITLTLPKGVKFAEGIDAGNDGTSIMIPAGKIVQISIFGSIATAIISQ